MRVNLPEVHELAELIPAMSPDEYERLREDIRANGLHEPITLYGGKILDGRHRGRVCVELGIQPTYKVYEGLEPARYVISLNVNRRHLSTAQRAAIAEAAYPYFQEAARKRMADGGSEGGKRAHQSQGVGTGAQPLGAADREAIRARDEAAATVGISGKTLSEFMRVNRKSPELHSRVMAGELSIKNASRQIATAPAQKEKIETKRDGFIAEKARERFGSILASLAAMNQTLPKVNLNFVIELSQDHELQQYVETLRIAESAIRRTREFISDRGGKK